jgi:hypothetical protein
MAVAIRRDETPSTMYDALEIECVEGARNPADAIDRVSEKYGADWCRDIIASSWSDYAYGDAVKAFNAVAMRARTDALGSGSTVTSIAKKRRKPGGLLETVIAIPVGDGGGFEYVPLKDITADQCEARASYYEQYAATLSTRAEMWRSWASELKKKKVASIGDLNLSDEELMALAE